MTMERTIFLSLFFAALRLCVMLLLQQWRWQRIESLLLAQGNGDEMKRKSHRHTWQTLPGNRQSFREGNIVSSRCVCVRAYVVGDTVTRSDVMAMIVITCIAPQIVHKHTHSRPTYRRLPPLHIAHKSGRCISSLAREALLAILVCTNVDIHQHRLLDFHSVWMQRNAMQIVTDLQCLINSVQALSVDSFKQYNMWAHDTSTHFRSAGCCFVPANSTIKIIFKFYECEICTIPPSANLHSVSLSPTPCLCNSLQELKCGFQIGYLFIR